jgi:hypothetical protein
MKNRLAALADDIADTAAEIGVQATATTDSDRTGFALAVSELLTAQAALDRARNALAPAQAETTDDMAEVEIVRQATT